MQKFCDESVSALHNGDKKMFWNQYLWEVAFKSGFCIPVPIQRATKAAMVCLPSLLRKGTWFCSVQQVLLGRPQIQDLWGSHPGASLLGEPGSPSRHIILRHPEWKRCFACSCPCLHSKGSSRRLAHTGPAFTACINPVPTYVEDRDWVTI